MQRKGIDAFLNKNLQERVKRELDAHIENDILANSYRLKNRFSHIWSYPSRKRFDEKLIGYIKDLNMAKVLDCGCGRGDMSLYILKQGGVVHGIDISPLYIQDATKNCIKAGYEIAKFGFYVMDAHAMSFSDNFFDLVVGLGILHHLDIKKALNEIYRVLKPGGRLLLQEPLADNPLLKMFRKLTPSARTKDERPFTRKDIKQIKTSERWISQMNFCGLLEAPAAVITSVLMPNSSDNVVLQAVDWFERKLNNAGFLNTWNQYVLINLVKRPIN